MRRLICKIIGHDWYRPLTGRITYCARCGLDKREADDG